MDPNSVSQYWIKKNSHGKSFNDHTIRRFSHPMQENKKPLLQRAFKVTSMQTPLEEELYNVKVEPKVSQGRLDELGCKLPWDWQVDQLVYIEEGEVRVVPEGSKKFMQFLAGDLVQYPKWLEADLFFNAPYRERFVLS
ncbi:hypothetical protein Bca52824_046200 [Brassica carinata]|uniref:(S)-ureidoglycine aminohydrolase cupin domain-containing protein n=1 Tax=Brassica carinata TaxID=52824 RepID=A0A8X7US84_BRACI|nr:hypothetical protein Bca52824_046200 [Brassica carinata]